jgi:hypothetical protein
MHGLLVLLGVIFFIGIFTRNRGDSVLDTFGSGAKGCLWIVLIIILLIILGIL